MNHQYSPTQRVGDWFSPVPVTPEPSRSQTTECQVIINGAAYTVPAHGAIVIRRVENSKLQLALHNDLRTKKTADLGSWSAVVVHCVDFVKLCNEIKESLRRRGIPDNGINASSSLETVLQQATLLNGKPMLLTGVSTYVPNRVPKKSKTLTVTSPAMAGYRHPHANNLLVYALRGCSSAEPQYLGVGYTLGAARLTSKGVLQSPAVVWFMNHANNPFSTDNVDFGQRFDSVFRWSGFKQNFKLPPTGLKSKLQPGGSLTSQWVSHPQKMFAKLTELRASGGLNQYLDTTAFRGDGCDMRLLLLLELLAKQCGMEHIIIKVLRGESVSLHHLI